MDITVNEVFDYLTKRGVIGGVPLLSEGAEFEDRVIRFPNLKITEKNYGQIKREGEMVEDRKILNKYVGTIGSNFYERINRLNEVGTGKAVGLETSELIASILLLDLLTAMVREFTPSSGGFLFEAFAAAMFEGLQIETAGANTVLTDIVSNIETETEEKTELSKNYSLKLIRPKGIVTGSIKLLEETWKKWRSMTYLVVNKMADDELVFYQFVLSPRWTPIGGDIVRTSGTKFRVNYGYYTQDKFKMGTLKLGDSLAIAQRYSEVLGEQIATIYNSLFFLTRNLEDYFVGDEKKKADEATKNADTLYQSVVELKKQ